ncbi:uncharacterized protein [Atheta coriaria]|uniref:uncharacterized protein n=1 Tax=Dalotia coriaria TaxID=877792 RepID=UPI0031F3B715
MPVLKTFCCCSSLRTGSIVAGIAAIILAIIGIIIIATVNVDLRTIIIDELPKWIVKIIVLINFAMTILISILLLIGILNRNMWLLLPFVVCGLMLAIGLLVSVLYTSINFFIDGFVIHGCIFLILGLITFVIYVYMWLVTYSFFQIVKEEYDTRAAYKKAPYRRQY